MKKIVCKDLNCLLESIVGELGTAHKVAPLHSASKSPSIRWRRLAGAGCTWETEFCTAIGLLAYVGVLAFFVPWIIF